MPVYPIPDGFRCITPYLTVEGAAILIAFLERAFEAVEVSRHLTPDGRVAHAAVRIGDSMVEISDSNDRWKAMPAALHFYVPDTDAVYQRAMEAGATSLHVPMDMFYGERGAAVRDPVGNHWYIATYLEYVSPEELRRRHEAFLREQQTRG